MVQLRSMLEVADNTGARKLMVIHVYGGHHRQFASLGDMVACSVKQAGADSSVKKGEVVKAVIVRTRKSCRRPDGSYVRFDDNAACVVDAEGEPKGTRVFGPIARELREKNYLKIISLAPEVV
ncbi:MAG: 50S ribosomal protein L14 [Elusimicrobia bacterium]|nr:50S ribosomal protein L14 [Elusimicrobiota bacterium]